MEFPREGIDVDVVTTAGIAVGSRPDPGLAAELPTEVTVTRIHPYVTLFASRAVYFMTIHAHLRPDKRFRDRRQLC